MPLPGFIARSPAWRIGLTVFAVHVLYVNSYLGNPMSKSILDLTVSLADRRSLDIDPYAGNSTDVSRRMAGDGTGLHYYSGMPPGLSFVCVPCYLAAKTWLWAVATPAREKAVDLRFVKAGGATWRESEKHLTVILLNLFICVFGCSALAGGMAVLFHRALGVLYPELEERRRLATTWLFSFATLWFIYSPGIYHRVFSTFLCFGAFLLAMPRGKLRIADCGLRKEKAEDAAAKEEGVEIRASRPRGLVFGLALGLAVATSYELAIAATVIVVYAATQWGRRWAWGWAAAGAGVFLVLLAAYHTACFGAPWTTPYAMRIEGSGVPPLFRTTGWPSPLERLYGFLIGSRTGFFFYSPILILALPAVRQLRRGSPHRAPVAVAFSIFLLLLAFHGASGYTELPGEFGFRMMKPAIPFLMLLVPLSYRWSWPWGVGALTALSAVIVGKGVMFGVHAGRPFWSDYGAYLARHGFSNYTLLHLQTDVWPGLSPWLISAIHLAALATILFVLWRFVWRAKEN